MGKIVLTRLDGRLAHGTVCSAWIPSLGITHVIIIHDVHCKDEFIQKIFKKAIPPGCTLYTISSDEAAEWYQRDKFGEGTILVLFGDIETAYKTYNKGYTFPELQVANISMPFGPNKKVVVHKGVVMDREDGEMLKELQDKHNVKIYFQCFPPETKRPLDDVLAKAKFKK